MEKIQYLDWGRIEWICEPESGSSDHLRVGISVMNPHSWQPCHLHYGDEQFMYIMSGRGWQKIGDSESLVEPGKYFHISSGMSHESRNDGDEPLVKLLVSIPAVISTVHVAPDKREKTMSMEEIDNQEFLRETIKELFRHNLRPLRIPISIYDEDQELVYQNREFPEFCKKCCGIEKNIYNCELYKIRSTFVPPYYEGVSAHACGHGLLLYILPIVSDGKLLGFIKTGHIRTRAVKSDDAAASMVYNVPESTENGMLDTIRNIAESICAHYQFCMVQVNLHKNKRELSDKIREDGQLQEHLKVTRNQMLNLQINQHFLFNTLNTIASMAVKENALGTYTAIGDLAQLFRYTLRTQETFVLLQDELRYVRNYTNLQKLRFGDRLSVIYDIEQDLLESQEVPFNFLQPIVENCFKHGFKGQEREMQIIILAYKEKNYLHFKVSDSGGGFGEKTRNEIEYKMGNQVQASGTSMVVRKLQSVFGNDFSYQVESLDGEGTVVSIKMPAARSERSVYEKSIIS